MNSILSHYLPGNKTITFQQLYERDTLVKIDTSFISFLEVQDINLCNQLRHARSSPEYFNKKDESSLLINLAPYVENFLANLFGIEQEVKKYYLEQDLLKPIFTCKRLFIQKMVYKNITIQDLININPKEVREKLEAEFEDRFCDLTFARNVLEWLKNEQENELKIKLAQIYSAWAIFSKEGNLYHKSSTLFSIPKKKDYENLIDIKDIVIGDIVLKQSNNLRHRDGHFLTDTGNITEKVLGQVNYCIWCHNQSKDSCSKGLIDKNESKSFQKNYFKESLTGCPLEEKISEMNFVKSKGLDLAALAIIIVDNPMVAATGHRICNDCMKSCIYQKQDPVNIPEIETSILRKVLSFNWGFEIYSLLTRWNPMNFRAPLPKSSTGYKVLIVGLGPAGFTLAHYLINEGHAVTAIDGLKLEPLPPEISGVDCLGKAVNFNPIKNISEIYEDLAERTIGGFGGVTEYGITIRWDKNFLKIIRLLLERRKEFLSFGGVRFGGTITIDQAFELGFDHIALCMGAGKPTILPLKNGLVSGVRQASDFLMALQLTGAASSSSIANLQIRLPIVVIGGGLTAIDTATEAMAYYPVQVEKLLSRYEILVEEYGKEQVQSDWTTEDVAIFQEFIEHAKAIRRERGLAKQENRSPNIQELIQSWGGVTIAYRKRLIDAPSYRQNYEEVGYAMEEGVLFAENLTPIGIEVDEFNNAASITFEEIKSEKKSLKLLPARTILIAAGTVPNTVLAKESNSELAIDGYHFQTFDEYGNIVKPENSCKPNTVYVLASIRNDKKSISFFGDLHPSFSGNVVKAMASAKKGYPIVSNMLARLKPQSSEYKTLWNELNNGLRATVQEVKRLTPTIVEIKLRAPFAAKAFAPGQFYRLQNFSVDALRIKNTSLLMEGIASTGTLVDKEAGLISTIILEVGGSSNLCKALKSGQLVILMGPTGEPTHIPLSETVLLVGGGLGNAVLFSIGQALKASGCKVLYFAGYKKIEDRYKAEQIERASDQTIWCCDESPGFISTRPNDYNFVGNVVEAMSAYAQGKIGSNLFPFSHINRIITIGSDNMMHAIAKARQTVLRDFFNSTHIGIGSINSPMQCMMKEICAQCLQVHHDPITKEERIVFSCSNQDQDLNCVDFTCLSNRLKQNSLQEKVTKCWIDYCLGSLIKEKKYDFI